MNEQDPHFPRKQAILKEFPDVIRLYGPDKRTLIYVIAVAAVQAGLAVWATTSWWHSILLGITVGPFLDAMILVIMHELSHNRMFGNILADRLVSMGVNVFMLAPISEIFRQHHRMHHLTLGDDHTDVDVPCAFEVKFVGNSTWKKALWLTFNMVFLPIRSLYKLEVKTDTFVILNWVTCLSFTVTVLFLSPRAFIYMGLSLLFSQGAHPANARQLQRHLWDGSEEKALNGSGHASHTYSFYGWSNALFLNVGYHNEHHDFAQVAWTRLPELRRMVGDKYYPDSQAYASRGMGDVVNFIFNPDISLSNFFSKKLSEAQRQACVANGKSKAVPDLASSTSSSLGSDASHAVHRPRRGSRVRLDS